jgi:hypothetical protein
MGLVCDVNSQLPRFQSVAMGQLHSVVADFKVNSILDGVYCVVLLVRKKLFGITSTLRTEQRVYLTSYLLSMFMTFFDRI